MSLTESATMTVEEFLTLPDDGIDRELIRGEARERGVTTRNRFHARAESRIAHLLWSCLETRPQPRGVIVSGEGGFRLMATKATLVGIVAAYVPAALEAAMDPKQSIPDGPPALAVEAHSPSDPREDVVKKVRLSFEVGTVVWVVDPDFRTVTVHRPDREPETFTESRELTIEPERRSFRVAMELRFGA